MKPSKLGYPYSYGDEGPDESIFENPKVIRVLIFSGITLSILPGSALAASALAADDLSSIVELIQLGTIEGWCLALKKYYISEYGSMSDLLAVAKGSYLFLLVRFFIYSVLYL